MTIKEQERRFVKELPNGDVFVATIRHDDRCGNGHNTFSITAEMYDRGYIRGEAFVFNAKGQKRYLGSCGCMHDEIEKHFPELSQFIRWHLTSTDGPMHYIDNTIYFVRRGELDNARKVAVAPEASQEQLGDKEWLQNRLPELLAQFRKDVESLGLEY